MRCDWKLHTPRPTGCRAPSRHGHRQARGNATATAAIGRSSGFCGTVRGRSEDRPARRTGAAAMQYGITADRVTSEGRMGSAVSRRCRNGGPAGGGIDAPTASDAQALERSRFRNACGHPRSVGCRSARAPPESDSTQRAGWTVDRPSVALSTYRARRRLSQTGTFRTHPPTTHAKMCAEIARRSGPPIP